jgi:glucokinase
MTILAGDIGGTKTRLGLFDGHAASPVACATYATADFQSPSDLVETFLASHDVRPSRACFGVAGPVVDGRVQPVNLPWVVDSLEFRRHFGIDALLVNDIVANARGIGLLHDSDLAVVNRGTHDPFGARAVVSAGTGLGEAALWWDGTRHRPAASEGGSASFGPTSPLEEELYRFLAAEQGRVTFGHICSGPGLRHIYRFLAGGADAPEPAVITAEAEADRGSIASAALDLFVSIYGTRAGDAMLGYAATGGVYLGGGIAPKILPRLLEGGFMRAFVAKGRLRWLLERTPVHVVLNADAALIGAAAFAQDAAPAAYLRAA